MKENQDYIQDIAEIRSMMERSSKFLSLSGWAGILAGVYALAGAYIAHRYLAFNPTDVYGSAHVNNVQGLMLLGLTMMGLALVTAIFFSYRRAQKRGEKLWNPSSRQLLVSMAVPFFTGGAFILILISHGLVSLVIPASLLFYGLALFNGSKFTYDAVKVLGFTEIVLGLVSAYYTGYGVLFWALGFGVAHILYGVYMYYRYER